MSRNFELMQKIEKRLEPLEASDGSELFLQFNQEDAQLESRSPKWIRQEVLWGFNPRDAEMIKLVQRLFFSTERLPLLPRATESPRAVVFADVEHSSGSALGCARAGEILASQGRGTVCLVDANLYSPSFHEIFGIENRNGFGEAMSQTGPIQDFVQRVSSGNLWVMPCGSLNPNSSLDPQRMRTRIKEVRNEFDYVLIDAPALNDHGAAMLLGRLTDGLVLVIQANSTRRETARKVKQELELANVGLLGAILNNRTFPIPEALYSRL
jgi:protein-tyrosine kinase